MIYFQSRPLIKSESFTKQFPNQLTSICCHILCKFVLHLEGNISKILTSTGYCADFIVLVKPLLSYVRFNKGYLCYIYWQQLSLRISISNNLCRRFHIVVAAVFLYSFLNFSALVSTAKIQDTSNNKTFNENISILLLHQIITGNKKWIIYDKPKGKKLQVDTGQLSTSTPKPNTNAKNVFLCGWWD